MVSTHLSQVIAVSGVKVSGIDLLNFRIQGLWDVALFPTVKATNFKGILLASSGSNSGRIRAFVNKNCYI